MIRSQKGQALLVVVLVMVVTLTIGLSIASRTITNIRNSNDEENSQKALSAAEAGIEQVLQTACSTPPCVKIGSQTANDTSYRVTTTIRTGTEFVMKNGNSVQKDQGGDIWMVSHRADETPDYTTPYPSGTITVYWGNNSESNECNHAAMELIVLTGTLASPVATRSVFDSCAARRAGNNFAAPSLANGKTIDGVSFRYQASFDVTNGLVARAVPLYQNSSIGFSGLGLPSQGKSFESVGEIGEVKRKVTLLQEWPSVPAEFFQYLFFTTL